MEARIGSYRTRGEVQPDFQDIDDAEETLRNLMPDYAEERDTDELQRRFDERVDGLNLKKEQLQQIHWARDRALEWHAGQQRKDGPFINHPFKVALLWMDLDLEVDDDQKSNAIAALLLHDTVEDCTKQIVTTLGGKLSDEDTPYQQRAEAFHCLEECSPLEFEAVDMIRALTFPNPTSFLTGDKQPTLYEKRVLYEEHTRKLLRDPLIRSLKLCDFCTNGCWPTPDAKKQDSLDQKYYGTFALHLEALNWTDSLVVGHAREMMREMLICGEKLARNRWRPRRVRELGAVAADNDAPVTGSALMR